MFGKVYSLDKTKKNPKQKTSHKNKTQHTPPPPTKPNQIKPKIFMASNGLLRWVRTMWMVGSRTPWQEQETKDIDSRWGKDWYENSHRDCLSCTYIFWTSLRIQTLNVGSQVLKNKQTTNPTG